MSTNPTKRKRFTLDEHAVRWRFLCSLHDGDENEALEAILRYERRRQGWPEQVAGAEK